MIDRLIKIADFLDKSGKEEDADLIDQVVHDLNDDSIVEIPEDEYEQLMLVFDSMFESLHSKPESDIELS